MLGLAAGASQQSNWSTWQLWFNGGSFGVKDPQFGKDIAFFAWDYPLYRLVLGFLYVVVILSILFSAGMYYLYGALRLQTPGPKITISARRHLTVLIFVFIVLKAISYWLDRYGLVFSGRGKVTGASYTDVNASLPAKTILFWIAVIIAAGVLASIWMTSPARAGRRLRCPADPEHRDQRHLPGPGPADQRQAERQRQGSQVHQSKYPGHP